MTSGTPERSRRLRRLELKTEPRHIRLPSNENIWEIDGKPGKSGRLGRPGDERFFEPKVK